MNRQWQKTIRDSVNDWIMEAVRALKSENKEYGIRLNYDLHIPDGLHYGKTNYIPITVPSNKGPLSLGEVQIEVDSAGDITSLVPTLYENIGLFSDEDEAEVYHGTKFNGGLDALNTMFEGVNQILNSDQFKSLMIPKTEGFLDSDLLSGSTSFNFGKNTGSHVNIKGSDKRIRVGRTRERGARWGDVEAETLLKDAKAAKSAKTKEEKEEYIKEALDSTKAPQWYRALGSRAKEKMEPSITKSYLKACSEAGEAMPSSKFFSLLKQSMLAGQSLESWCGWMNEPVDGSVNGECLNKGCSIYDPHCNRLTHKLNTEKHSLA